MRKPTRFAAGAVAAAAVAAAAVQALPAGASTAAPDGTRVTATPDGTRVTVLDGTRVTASPDGTRVTASPDGTRVTVPMTITGFNAAVAKAHGYTIRTNAQGRQYSVKTGAAANVATPDNTVYGNCGSSFMYEAGIGNHQVEISTGFNVIAPASVVFWTYSMQDRGGTSSHTRDYGLDSVRSWTDNERWGALTPGPARAWVSTGSEVILDSGALCTSAGPSDTTTIY